MFPEPRKTSYAHVNLTLVVLLISFPFIVIATFAQVPATNVYAADKKSDAPAFVDRAAERRISADAKTAAEGVVKMKESIDALRNMQKTSLERLMDVNKAASKLSKAGKALGAMGAGLGVGMAVLDMFGVFGPSAEEQTAQALQEISGKIDNLEQTMLGKIGELQASIEHVNTTVVRESAKTQIRDHLNTLSALQKRVDVYYQALNGPNRKMTRKVSNSGDYQINYADLDNAEHLLTTGTTPAQIHDAVNAVFEQVMGKNMATNLMEAEYKSSFGDMSHLAEISNTLLKMVAAGQTHFVMVSVMKKRRGAEDDVSTTLKSAEERVKYNARLRMDEVEAISNNADKLFSPMYQQITKALNSYTDRAIRERDKNAKAFLDREFGDKKLGKYLKGAGENFSFNYQAPGDKLQLHKKLQKMLLCDTFVMVHQLNSNTAYDNFVDFASGASYTLDHKNDDGKRYRLTVKWIAITADSPRPTGRLRPVNLPKAAWESPRKMEHNPFGETGLAAARSRGAARRDWDGMKKVGGVRKGQVPVCDASVLDDRSIWERVDTLVPLLHSRMWKEVVNDGHQKPYDESGMVLMFSSIQEGFSPYGGGLLYLPQYGMINSTESTDSLFTLTSAPDRIVLFKGKGRHCLMFR